MNEWWHWSPLQGSERLGFAIIGVGRFGIAVCRELLQNGADVLAVDRSARAIEELRQVEPSVEARVVDCTDEESLREAGVLDMGTDVAAISEPIEGRMTATLIAKDSEGRQVKQVIARATSGLHEKMLKRVGADRVIFPSRMQGERLGLELVRPNLMERLALDEQHCIEEIKVPELFVGRSLRDLNLRKNFRVNVLAAGPQSSLTVNPPASHVLELGHLLVVMGLIDDLQRLPKRESVRCIGRMSGTSADGVDAVLADFRGSPNHPQWDLIRPEHHPYPAALRHRVATAGQGAPTRADP